LGIPGLELVDRSWLKAHEPNLSEEIEGALPGPTAAVINPYETVYALAENAVANGLRLFCHHQVTAIERGKDTWKITASGKAFEATPSGT
jgi:glycerol-3-phosphate dehydrogenase